MDVLRRERLERGWSQARLAEVLGTDPGTVSRWERGVTSPTAAMRERLCQIYERSASELGLLQVDECPPVTSASPARPESNPGELVPSAATADSWPERALAAMSYLGGWVSGVLVIAFGWRRPFVRRHAARSILVFGLINAAVVAGATTADRDAAAGVLRGLTQVATPLLVLGGLIAWVVFTLGAARGRPAAWAPSARPRWGR